MLSNFQKIEDPEKKKIIKLAILIILLAVLIFIFKKSFVLEKNVDRALLNYVGQSTGVVLGEKDTILSANGLKSVAASENYRLTQVNLGGVNAEVMDFTDSGLFQIGNIKSELYFSKEETQKETRAVISFDTSRQSYAEIEYFKNGDSDKNSIKSLNLGRSHVITIPELNSDSVYRYLIKAEDPSGNLAVSEQFVIYTGAAEISLVDILEEAARKVFGWAF